MKMRIILAELLQILLLGSYKVKKVVIAEKAEFICMSLWGNRQPCGPCRAESGSESCIRELEIRVA